MSAASMFEGGAFAVHQKGPALTITCQQWGCHSIDRMCAKAPELPCMAEKRCCGRITIQMTHMRHRLKTGSVCL